LFLAHGHVTLYQVRAHVMRLAIPKIDHQRGILCFTFIIVPGYHPKGFAQALLAIHAAG
jgi:hypothetical protein